MKRIGVVLAGFALSPLATGCNRGGPGEAAQSITIPFAPPLGQPLYYRFQRTSQDATGRRTSQSLFVVTFSRASDGLFMAVWPLRPNGERVSETGIPPALADRRFRVGSSGELLGMENEAAYWAAIEPRLAQHGPTAAQARESRAMLQSAHDTRALPLADRMGFLAENAWPITYYAGDRFTREPRETHASKQSIAGYIEGTRRIFARDVTPDHIVIVDNFTISPERMQAALNNFAARNGGRLPGVGAHHISNVSEVTVTLDSRTGLVQQRRDRQELVTEEGGRTMRQSTITLLERVDAPRRPAADRPANTVTAVQPAR
jgi:hypothetical protein